MDLPEHCPHCLANINIPGIYEANAYWIIRTEIDFDSNNQSRIDDQIFECSNCHTLFRLRWELISFVELEERKQ
ncbi:hypothetical protein MUP77_21730 [Candidatus Bathyarchaeota archaeon]|nr:hypothetical protein [Candidatus Bathyarchaeota archaeon]